MRQDCRFSSNTVCIITERFVERGPLPYRTVDQIGVSRIAKCKYVCLDRNKQLLRRIGKLSENCLAAHNHHHRGTGDAASGANNVLKLFATHAGIGV